LVCGGAGAAPPLATRDTPAVINVVSSGRTILRISVAIVVKMLLEGAALATG
jgi:hypothetical protein